MRVLLLSPGYPPAAGGVEVHVKAVAGALVRQGHTVTVLTLDAHSPVETAGPGDLDEQGVRVVRVPVRTVGPFEIPRGLLPRLRDLTRRHDVVHAHNYHSPLPLLALATVRHTPVVVTPHFHGGGHTLAASLAHPLYRRVMALALPRAAALVFVSAAERDRFEATFGGLDASATVIHNGARSPATVSASGERRRERLVLAIGRLEAYKRVDALVEAAGLWDDATQVVVVGDGPERARLERLAPPPGRDGAPRVRFAGRVDDAALDDLLSRAAVVVTSSAHEAFGMVAVDALAAGARVVASDIPAHREVAALHPEGVTLWDADSGIGGLAALVSDALDLPAAPLVPLPTWDDAATALAQAYVAVAPTETPKRSVR